MNELWSSTDRVRIHDGGVSQGRPLTDNVLVSIDNPSTLAELRLHARVEAGDAVCMCLGSLALEFQSRGRTLGVVGFHHGVALRWEARWNWDAMLTDGDSLVDWLAGIGVDGPAKERSASRERQHVAHVAAAEWRTGIPGALADLADEMLQTSRTGSVPAALVARLVEALTAAVPDPIERAATLLRWFGTGDARCTAVPIHEFIPQRLLLGLPIEVLAAAVDVGDPRVVDGAIRLFVGWDFRTRRSDLKRMPPAVLEHLAEVAARSSDDDKRSRAERVFAEVTRST